MNIYIIGSSSFHIVDEEIKKICNNKKWENINFLNMSLEDLISEVSYGSLFNEEKIIVVRNASFLGNNDDVSLLEKYIASPNQLTTLILTTYEKIDERKKAVKVTTYWHSTDYKHVSFSACRRAADGSMENNRK